MKKCIWCSRTEEFVLFNKEAHTIPQSLGGKNICDNVCDECNKYFGDKERGYPSVEIALKEALNLSRHILLSNRIKKPIGRFKSEYFDFKPNSRTIKTKIRYQFQKNFQLEFGKRFRRGIYKVYLEERERQLQDGHDDRFNFIREFSRFGLSDYPIYVIKPKFQSIFFSELDVVNPQIRFTPSSDELDKEYRLYTYPLMGHNFVIPTSQLLLAERVVKYQNYLLESNSPFGHELVAIKKVEDLDFRFAYMRH